MGIQLRLAFFMMVIFFLIFGSVLGAQTIDDSKKVFVMVGPYAYGNLVLNPQSTVISPEWQPHVGGGMLLPLGKGWAGLFDLTTSTRQMNWNWDGDDGQPGPSDNLSRLRRISVLSSLVRVWDREFLSMYVGGGVGVEHDHERSRFRPIVTRNPSGEPILASEFVDAQFRRTGAGPTIRGGILVSLGPRIVARVGYSYLRRYDDIGGSQGIETGIGYRF